MALVPEDYTIIKLKEKIEQLEKNGIQKQVSGLSIAKGQSVTDKDIIGAKELVLYYTNSTLSYFGSIIVSQKINNWYKVFVDSSKVGYFMVYWDTGIITSSTGTDEIIKLIGYDIIK